MVDLNKEIKLSDLFRRRPKPPEDAAAEAAEREPKKERRALFSRTPRDGSAPGPTPPEEPRARRSRRRSKAEGPSVEARPAAAVPQIPLMRAFDLMPREEVRDRGGRVGAVQIALALLGLVVVAGLAGAYLFTSAGVTAKQGELDDLRAQLAELEVPAEAPDGAAELESEGQARTGALSVALAQRIAWDRILREVSLVLPDDVFLIQLSASTPNAAGAAAAPAAPVAGSASPNSLALVGFAGSQESVAVVLSRLAAVPELVSVQLQSSSLTGDEAGGGYQFSLIAGVDPLGGGAS